ncbi:NAD-binding protein [Aliarcobacter butzleri]|uniref:NAD-binding protein n=1 Tax=Aliarcobacter butzleri TaxID=28197 RepID=UPI0021B2DE4F|nr:NAD-binding protein [Aliarcobacter butzleri]MCT7603923.1 NAD-binding protein [Aliarcobacter butzleri]
MKRINIYNWLKSNRGIIIALLACCTIIGASIVYYKTYDREWYEAIIFSLQLFALDTKIPDDFGIENKVSDSWRCIYLFSLSGFITTFFTVIVLFLDKPIYQFWIRKVKKNKFILVCGLGKNNRIYIDSELETNDMSILVIENNKDNLHIDSYKAKGVGVILGDATDESLFADMKFENIKHIIISVGNDMRNLEIATQILQKSKEVKLYIHLENRNLRYFHKENGLLQGSNIKLYSYYEDSSRELFKNYDIDGNGYEVLNSKDNYNIVIVGNTNLAYEVIFQACIMGQLPNENLLTIYCLDKYPNKFRQKVELNYTEIHNVPNVEIKYLRFDIYSKKDYEQDFWYENNLTNIILCYENEETNLNITANLADITYLEKIVKKEFKTNILLAIFNEYNISNSIKSNKDIFENFFTFGLTKDICTKEYLIDEIRDKRAKATNEVYNQSLEDNSVKKQSWNQRSYFEKESNRTSADHIKIKEKYLEFDNSDFAKEKLARCEHNRWNAFHYLHGWKYAEETNKSMKLHNCLLPYDSLKEDIKYYDREMINNIDKIKKYENIINAE